MNLSVCCADVGSVARGNFGWAFRDLPGELSETPKNASIAAFTAVIADRLARGRTVAVGFECPLFVPLRQTPADLTKARAGEGNRPWSAGAGAGSMATGLVEVAWVLRELAYRFAGSVPLSFDWEALPSSGGGLFLWEAFVSRAAKADTHHGDAGLGVQAFCAALPDPTAANCVHEPEVFSLVGAAALRAGWPVPSSALAAPCVVVQA